MGAIGHCIRTIARIGRPFESSTPTSSDRMIGKSVVTNAHSPIAAATSSKGTRVTKVWPWLRKQYIERESFKLTSGNAKGVSSNGQHLRDHGLRPATKLCHSVPAKQKGAAVCACRSFEGRSDLKQLAPVSIRRRHPRELIPYDVAIVTCSHPVECQWLRQVNSGWEAARACHSVILGMKKLESKRERAQPAIRARFGTCTLKASSLDSQLWFIGHVGLC
eukprot:7386142-Prymnesium_polylepis.3